MIYELLYETLDILFQSLYLALMARVLLSWIPHNPYNGIIQFLYQVTDPLLRPFQNIIPSYKLGIDVSPILAFFALGMIRKLVFQLLF
jgi:YggT family protein